MPPMPTSTLVVITGASSGIGAALAELYAVQGKAVLLVARRRERLEHIMKICLSKNPAAKVELLLADVTAPEFPKLLQQAIDGRSASLAFVNAGFGVAGTIEKLSLADYRRQMETNVFGALQTVQATLPALRQVKGRLVLIGSMNSYLAFPMGSAYSMSKFALRALAESLYCELSDVNVSIVCPGPVDTEILQINNQGERVLSKRPNIGPRTVLSVELAAKRIAQQVACGRREIFLSWDMAVLAWLHRHFPSLTLRLMRHFFQKKRAYFAQLVGQVNPDAV